MSKEVKIEFQKDQYGNLIYSTDYALSMIATSLSNLESGLSRITVDNNVSEDIYLPKVEEQFNELITCISNINSTLDDLNSNSIELNNNMELIVMQLARIADSLEKKK